MTAKSKFIMIVVTAIMLNFTAKAEDEEVKTVKDYGIRGHMFRIAEQSLLEVIHSKLAEAESSGKLETLQQEFKERVTRKVLRPTPVTGLVKAERSRSWSYNPAITQITPITDGRGNIVVAAGTRVNPLDTLSWGKPLLFINGDDVEQVAWAKNRAGDIVLVNGAPLELSQALDRSVYFDQGGVLVQKFKLEALPAIVEQEGKQLKVSEVKI